MFIPNSEYINKYNVQYFKENPDYHNPKFNTKFGVYSEGCGLDNVLMSWGHDDYMYLVSLRSSLFGDCKQFVNLHVPIAAGFFLFVSEMFRCLFISGGQGEQDHPSFRGAVHHQISLILP